MKEKVFSRRDFIKLGGLGMGVAAASQLFPPRVARASQGGVEPISEDGYIHTLCEMCVWRCGVRAKVVGDRVVKLEGNPEHPHSRGRLCARGQSGLMHAYDPDRVLSPMIRAGRRGEGLFRKVSWDEALDYTAEKMQTIKNNFGPEAMVFSATHSLSQVQFENLLNGFGSPNYGTQRSLCFNAMVTAFLLTYGVEEPSRNYENASYILMVGRNMMEAISTSETSALVEALARGAKLVYLDPRFTKTAAKAGEWIPIRPGTDSAFLLAMINVIVTNQIGDCDFVQHYVVGCEGLPEAVKDYTPAWAETITGVPAATIERIAREFAAAGKDAMAHPGWRTSNFVNSFQTERAIATLNAITGAVLRTGGCIAAESPEASGITLGKPPQPPYPRVSAQRLDGIPWKYPLVPLKLGIFQELREAMLSGQPYQARGWFIARQNPVLALPDRQRTLEAFGKMDFIANVDAILNDTAWFADVILPEATYLERYDPLSVIEGKICLRQPVIEAQGEARSALWIYKELGTRLGLADFFQYEDEVDYIKQQLAPTGVSFETLSYQGVMQPEVKPQPAGEILFNTPTGKIEVYSAALENVGFSPWPTWVEPPRPKPEAFYLLTGKVGQHTQMGTQNNQLLHKYEDRPELWMSPAAAEQRSLTHGDLVEVTSEVGSVKVGLKVTKAIRDDCVYLTPGYGHLSKGLTTAFAHGASDSVLHVTITDPISGGQALSETFVTVAKA